MNSPSNSTKGFILITVSILIAVLIIGATVYLRLVSGEARMNKGQIDSAKALYLAEAGLEKEIYDMKINVQGDQPIQLGSRADFYVRDMSGGNPANYLEDIAIAVNVASAGTDLYEIISTCTVGVSQRSIHALVQKNPPARVFDYAYFINNWGWFYGRGITADGDVRSNGRFDFRDNPRVNGEIWAGEEIDDGGDGIRGKGGEEENQHPNSDKLPMPNLQDIIYYENLAIANGGTLEQGGATIINAIHGDDAGEADNIVLIGTPSNPLVISGPVVVRGDVIIKGTVQGQGTIYSGRNIYIADNLKYKNAPNSPRPASDNPDVVDGWVAANSDKDLLGLAARENIIMGDYTKSTYYGYTGGDRWWADSYLFNMGSEDVGEDGIPDTDDTGEGDGVFQSEYEDLDGDSIFDDNYGWSDVETQADITLFDNLPAGTSSFGDLASNSIHTVEGILYTNHAYAGRTGNNTIFNGALVSKDEAIIYRNNITFNYDERIHSKYRSNPNWLIDLSLPVVKTVEVKRWWE